MRLTAGVAFGVGIVVACSAARAEEEVVRDDWVKFSLDAFVEWNDNRDSVSDTQGQDEVEDRFAYEKTDTMKFGIGPMIHFYQTYKSSHLRLEYGPMYQWWENPRVGQTKTEWTHQAYGELRYNTGERMDFYLRDSLKYIDDPDIYMGSEEPPFDPADKRLTEENSHLDNRVTTGFRYRLTQRIYSDLNAYWRTKRFDEPLLADNGDEDDMGVSLYNWIQQSALFSYGVTLAYTTYDRESVDDLPMGLETYSIGVGGRYKVNKYLDVTASYGYETAMHENEEIDDRSYPTETKLEVSVIPSARARLIAGVKLDVDEGYVYPYVSQERTAFYSSLSYRHTSKLSTTYRLDYRQCDYEEKYTNPETPDDAFYGSRDGTRDELFARVGLNYRWTDKLQTSVYYAFEDIDSDVTDSYSRNTLGARVRYEF